MSPRSWHGKHGVDGVVLTEEIKSLLHLEDRHGCESSSEKIVKGMEIRVSVSSRRRLVGEVLGSQAIPAVA